MCPAKRHFYLSAWNKAVSQTDKEIPTLITIIF